MHAWEAIQSTLDYIETHMDETIRIEALAQRAALSPFYYQRLFSRLVKKPVREYIRLRRLARASTMLREGDVRILDIALDCGFGSHEGFTRAFRDAFGLTPAQYRERPVALNQFDKPDLLLNYVLVDEGVPLISEGLVLEMNRRALREPIRFMGISGYVPIDGQMPLGEATGVDIPGQIWERFHCQKHRIPRVPDSREVGVAYMGDAPGGCFTYFTGAEVAPGAEDDGFTAWELPAREYVVCGFEAESFEELVTAALNKAVKYSAQWLEQKGLVMAAYSPELYYQRDQAVPYMELWMPANKG
ncbi:AraC family transcriptional regulator [Eubacterium sp. 1001713B170207_170306_E7]|uniref:AraC family transcriptional regulator n=1 Tax=Eubacterium sp. 1001713B170207_170306_E7 TaxID=2787097 RepID=UPI001897DFA7|nr:AraC family transcriptional regulator [Eubacterium sp. 1001713B170207_170306_E7]